MGKNTVNITARQEQIIRDCTQGRISKDEAVKQLKKTNGNKK